MTLLLNRVFLFMALFCACVFAQTCSMSTTCESCQGPSCGWCNSTHTCMQASSGRPLPPNTCSGGFAVWTGSPLCLFPGPVTRCDCYCAASSTGNPFYIGSFQNDGCQVNADCQQPCSVNFPTQCPASLQSSQQSECQLTLPEVVKNYLGLIIGIVAGVIVISIVIGCCCCQATCCMFQCCAGVTASLCSCIPCCPRREQVVIVHASGAAYAPPSYQPLNTQPYSMAYAQQGQYPAQQYAQQQYAQQQYAQQPYAQQQYAQQPYAQQPVIGGYPQYQQAAPQPQQFPPSSAGMVMPGGHFIPPAQGSFYAPSAPSSK